MAASPLSTMLLPALMRSIGGGGGSPDGAGAPGGGAPSPTPGPNPEALGAAVSSEYASLQNVDPAKILADLNRYKQAISAIFPTAVTRVADAAKGISQAVTGLNSAIKAFEKAQEGLNNTRPALGISTAQQQPSAGMTPFGPQPTPSVGPQGG